MKDMITDIKNIISSVQHSERRIHNLLGIIEIYTDALDEIVRVTSDSPSVALIAINALQGVMPIYVSMAADPWPLKETS